MLPHNAKMLLRACSLLKMHIDKAESFPKEKIDARGIATTLKGVAAACSDSGLMVASTMAEEYTRAAEQIPDLVNSVMFPKLVAVHEAVEAELGSVAFLRVRPENKAYLSKEPLFGIEVNDKFPSAIRDIESAGKCLAYEMGTACVFHMMRVMEMGLKALAKALGIPYAPSWESYLRQIDARITAKHKTKGIKWKRDETMFRNLHGDLQAIKIAWRNPTMHIVRSYSPEEAEDVYRAVRAFMKHLSAKFSETR